MKKLIALALGLSFVFALAACGSSAKNGTYTAEMDAAYAEENNNGWQDVLIVTYEDGKIVKAEFDSYRVSDGMQKSTFEDYPMDYSPEEWIPLINQNIVSAGKASDVDTVAGATNASDSAKKLLEAIEKDGKAGETITVNF